MVRCRRSRMSHKVASIFVMVVQEEEIDDDSEMPEG